jgi:large subunit ribosomal protein L32e
MKMPRKFVRVDTCRFSRLGKNRRKLQKWRRPRGKHNKVRLKRFSYPVAPVIGFKSPRNLAGKISGLTPVLVHNLKELEALGKSSIAILARIGAKKKIEMIKKAEELKIQILNVAREKK